MLDTDTKEKLKNIRKLEHQAKQLLRKMDRIESEWNDLKEDLVKKGKQMPNTLGDVLSYWQKKNN